MGDKQRGGQGIPQAPEPGCTSHSGVPVRLGIGHSIRPGTVVPPAVLVSSMGSGALYLSGWQQEQSAYLTPEDAMPLRRELARAFGGEDRAAQDNDELSS